MPCDNNSCVSSNAPTLLKNARMANQSACSKKVQSVHSQQTMSPVQQARLKQVAMMNRQQNARRNAYLNDPNAPVDPMPVDPIMPPVESFQCRENQCVKTESYPNFNSCLSRCPAPVQYVSYVCNGSGVCEQTDIQPDEQTFFSNPLDCQTSCPVPVTPNIYYKCTDKLVPANRARNARFSMNERTCEATFEEPNGSNNVYLTESDCQTACNNPVVPPVVNYTYYAMDFTPGNKLCVVSTKNPENDPNVFYTPGECVESIKVASRRNRMMNGKY
jgi:hypothetical protein